LKNKKLLAVIVAISVTTTINPNRISPTTAVPQDGIEVVENVESTIIIPTDIVMNNENLLNHTSSFSRGGNLPMTAPIYTDKVIEVPKRNEKINIRVSHYTNDKEGDTEHGQTASNKNIVTLSKQNPNMHYIAAPEDIPMGTIIDISDIGLCTVIDRGSAIHWDIIDGERYMKIDLFVLNKTKQQVKDLGVFLTTGTIIKED
jgi:3D (Asp-Asp-Asp) domain-containing protein